VRGSKEREKDYLEDWIEEMPRSGRGASDIFSERSKSEKERTVGRPLAGSKVLGQGCRERGIATEKLLEERLKKE